jgi:hypothetical protein
MKKSALSILVLLASMTAYSADIPAEIVSAINSGNAAMLSGYLNNTVELTLLEKEGVYSNTQTEVILKNFFVQNPPKEFKLLHEGGKESSKYAIGNYVSDSKTYRITLFFKSEEARLLIHQMRIENEYVE